MTILKMMLTTRFNVKTYLVITESYFFSVHFVGCFIVSYVTEMLHLCFIYITWRTISATCTLHVVTCKHVVVTYNVTCCYMLLHVKRMLLHADKRNREGRVLHVRLHVHYMNIHRNVTYNGTECFRLVTDLAHYGSDMFDNHHHP